MRILVVAGEVEAQARAWLIGRGLRHGDIKFPALRTEDGWPDAFAPEGGTAFRRAGFTRAGEADTSGP